MEQLLNVKVNIPAKEASCYDILIGTNLLEKADEIIKKYTKADKFLVVTDKNTAKLYKNNLNIENAHWLVLEAGEEYKNINTLKTILDAAVEHRLERSDCIIAFGGGVIGDMAGFVAASYMRGCDFIQIPTTLLAQVDSSVGGKVAINHEHGKNLIGAFYQPKLVLADITTLKTLDIRQLKTGLCEVLKYAFIEKTCNAPLNYRLFDFLKQHKEEIFDLNPAVVSQLINICCSLKASVVNQDETEKGIRAILNLGHTFAHAIESLTNYTVYTHGEAVALGMKMAFKMSLQRGFIEKHYFELANELLDEYDIVPDFAGYDREKLYPEMALDKKARNGKLRFVLPNGFGSVTVANDVTEAQVLESVDIN